MERVAKILEDDPLPRVAAVLSACRGVTDALLDARERRRAAGGRRRRAAGSDPAAAHRHRRRAARPPAADDYVEELTANCREIAGILQTGPADSASRRPWCATSSPASARSGRRASSRATSRPAARGPVRSHWIDAREIVQIDQAPLGPSILWPESRANADRLIPRAPERARSSSPASSRAPARDCRRRSAATAAISPASIFGALLDAVGDRDLDRRGRRAERRSAPRAGRDDHRLALVQRGDGARALRREGHPSRRRWRRR